MRSPLPAPHSRRLPISILVFAIAILYFAREVLIPLALAALFSFLFAPLVRRLERWHFGRAPAVLSVTIVSLAVIGLIGWATSLQIIDLAAKFPGYKDNIQRKLSALENHGGSLQSAAKALQEIEEHAAKESAPPPVSRRPGPIKKAEKPDAAGNATATPDADAEADKNPMPVRVVEPPPGPPQILHNLLGPLLAPAATVGIVLLFTIFILLRREDLRDRLLHLAGPERLPITTQAIDEAASRVSKYLVAQVCVNASFGVAIATGLYFIHVPNAILWGLLAGIFRFVPYIGAMLSACGPLVLSLAAFQEWQPVCLVLGLFAGLELVIGNAVEPFLYGSSTGVSPVAVIMAATFWTWLWGGVGLLLSTPLTVCIVVLGRHVPQLEYLNTLLGDEPVVPMDTRLYQRLLAYDQEEVSAMVDEYLKDHTPIEFYDEVLIPALNQAQIDARVGNLGEDRLEFVRNTAREVVDDLRDRPPSAFPALVKAEVSAELAEKTADGTVRPLDPTPTPPVVPVSVLILPVKTDADELAGNMLSHLLTLADIGAEAVSTKALTSEIIADIEKREIGLVCISAVRPFALMHARHLAKRVRLKFPQVKVLIGLWDGKKPAAATLGKGDVSRADWIVSTMAEAVREVRQAHPCLAAFTATAAEAEKVVAEAKAAVAEIPKKPHDLVEVAG